MKNTEKREEILRENEIRKEKYFRKVDQIRGDSRSECIPRKKISLLGTEYYLPVEMFEKDIILSLVEKKGVEGTLTFLKQKVTREAINDLIDGIMNSRIKYDFEFWAATICTIQDKQTKANIRLILNRGQRETLKEYEYQRINHIPIRVIIVKARQWGGSTLTQCYMLWLQLYHYENWHSAIISKVNSQSANIRSMISRVITNYPQSVGSFQLRPFESMVNTKFIPERGCRITISSAEKPEALRSFDFAMCHMSELATWTETATKSGDDLAQAIASTIPYEEGTLIVKESTAKGVGGYFHDEWIHATSSDVIVEGKDVPVFIPWYKIELYKKPVRSYKKLMDSMSQYNWWQWRQGATLEGIAWYNDFKESHRWSEFQMKSEYPTTADEAFQTKAGKYFTDYAVEYLRSTCKEPSFIGDIKGNALTGKEALEGLELIENDASETERLKIWIKPEKINGVKITNRFVVVVDIGGLHYKSDNSVISVFDRKGLIDSHGVVERAAVWYGHIDHDLLAWKAAQIAKFYDNAMLVIETNTLDTKDKKVGSDIQSDGDHSYTVINEISDFYGNIYMRMSAPDSAKVKTTFKYGWHMNRKTKYQAYDDYRGKIRDGFYVERCHEAANEAAWLELTKDGKIQAVKGRRDDIQDTTAVGVYISFNVKDMPLPRLIDETKKRQTNKRRRGGASTF